jgi:hypothetical protein
MRIIIPSVFILSALYVFLLFGLPLVGIFLPFPFIREANPYNPWYFSALLHVLPLIGILLSYILFLISNIFVLYFPKRNISQKFLRIYKPFEPVHAFTILLSMPFLFPLGFFIVSALVMKSVIAFGHMQIVLGIFLWIIWFRKRTFIFSRIVAIVAIVIALSGVFFFGKESMVEFYPKVRGNFPLNNKDGVYMINYDGDYWLTYYLPEQYCWNKNAEGGKLEKVCKVNLVKHGNTAIVEAPTDLKKYLDKLVNVSGSFVPVLPPIGPGKEYRQFCITKPKRVCSDSKGPGVWYFSPLKLQSIKLAH